jgi:hypothetical protein
MPMMTADAPLGVPGYTFADLHEPKRLASLYDRFAEELRAADPALWSEWAAYQKAPDAPRSPVALSTLLIAMAAHVSRFVTRLFSVGPQLETIAEATRAQDDLFRFKVDFVRRRALPLLKGGHVPRNQDDDATVERLASEFDARSDRELAVARAGCALLDLEKSKDQAVATLQSDIESLKRWCAARIHDREYRSWVLRISTTGTSSRRSVHNHSFRKRCSDPIGGCGSVMASS